MEEIKSPVTAGEPAKNNRQDMIISIAALALLAAPIFAFCWYFINLAVTQWLPLHEKLMITTGGTGGWWTRFAASSWRLASWISPAWFIAFAVAAVMARPSARWNKMSDLQKDNYRMFLGIGMQLLILYFITVSFCLIMGWGNLVLSLPAR